jgi:hypothetical protein
MQGEIRIRFPGDCGEVDLRYKTRAGTMCRDSVDGKIKYKDLGEKYMSLLSFSIVGKGEFEYSAEAPFASRDR